MAPPTVEANGVPSKYEETIRSNASKAGVSSLKRSKLPPQVIRFQVQLEEPNRIFFAGDELKGRVQVHLSDSLPVQGIILRIVGEAYVNVSDEPRPWTAKRIGRNLRNRKISPSSICEQMDIYEPGDRIAPAFFGSNPSAIWETSAVTTTVTIPRSQKSTLQREPAMESVAKKKSRLQEENNRKFRSHEKYFEHRAYVFGHKYSSSREIMWTGNHDFPFAYSLPSKLPASFHGRFGYVRYFCEASLERHNQPTIQRRAFFSVNNVMDLNLDSKADSGVSKEKKTNSWCFCCASGTIIVSAKVRRRGFVPGEIIPIQAHILNVSNKTIEKTSAKIVQIATYYSSKAFRNHEDETIVCEKTEGRIPPGESSTWDSIGPRVPPIPPSSTMIDCKLITLGYRLDFVLDITGMKECLVLKMPLRIGSIPLEKTFYRMASGEEDDFWTPQKTTLPTQILLKYPNMPEAYSLKCIKGERNVNRYYFRQIPRLMNSMIGINLRMPNAPAQPVVTDEGEVYAPRYVTYRECKEEEEVEERKAPNGAAVAEDVYQGHLVIEVSAPPRGTAAHIIAETMSSLSDSLLGSPVSSRITPVTVDYISILTESKKEGLQLRHRQASSAPPRRFLHETKKEK